MKFRVEHLMRGVTLPEYEALYFDEPFNQALSNHVKLKRELVKRELVDKAFVRRVKIAPSREIPAPVAKILGTDKLEYVEHIDYVWGSYSGTWKTEPAILADKIISSGRFSFVAHADGVTRVVEGDIQVKIFGVGGIAERFVVADVEKSYAQAAEFTQRYISEGKHKGS